MGSGIEIRGMSDWFSGTLFIFTFKTAVGVPYIQNYRSILPTAMPLLLIKLLAIMDLKVV